MLQEIFLLLEFTNQKLGLASIPDTDNRIIES